jgi:transcriptional regulator with XRE-family HTH domain
MPQKRVRLKRVRKSAGLTQEELAYLLKVDRSTVGRWESGENEPSADVQPRLARALKVSRSQLTALLAEASAASETRGPYAATRRNRADPAAVDELSQQITALGDDYESQPSTSLLAPASRCHAAVTGLLHQGGTDRTLAYCAEAIAHAEEAGDRVSAAKAELRTAYVSLYGDSDTRNPRTALRVAQHAAEQSQDISPALRGVTMLHVGEAFAMLGEYRQCERALSDADTAFSRMVADDPAADWFSPTQFGRLAGSCYLSLGSPERAESFLTDTATQLHDRPKTRSLVLGNLALSYLRQRQLDTATATLDSAIDLLEQSRGGGGMTVVFGAARELYPWRQEPAVQDIQDRLLALMA